MSPFLVVALLLVALGLIAKAAMDIHRGRLRSKVPCHRVHFPVNQPPSIHYIVFVKNNGVRSHDVHIGTIRIAFESEILRDASFNIVNLADEFECTTMGHSIRGNAPMRGVMQQWQRASDTAPTAA
jgi:hypothetical protein